MIKIIFFNNNKIIVEVSKTTKLEKKIYSKKDRYIFIRPNHKRKRKGIKKLSYYYGNKIGGKKRKRK